MVYAKYQLTHGREVCSQFYTELHRKEALANREWQEISEQEYEAYLAHVRAFQFARQRLRERDEQKRQRLHNLRTYSGFCG